MKLQVKKGTASKLLDIFISDSSSTTGAGLTGLVYNSAGLTAYYYREGAASATAITLATMTLGTWATGGFVVVDGTNMPGCYQLGIPDAALATGANSVIVMLKGATNMAPLTLEIELVDNVVADTYSRLGAPAGASVSADVAAVKTDTGNNYAIVNHASYGNAQLVRSTTPANTLDVSATGEAGLDFANIKDATGAKTLTNITVPTVTAVTNDVGITQAGADKVWGTAARALTDKAGFSLTSAEEAAIVDLVWDEAIAGHLTAGTTGAKLNSAASAGDPWTTALPGAYGSGSAGYILGTNLNATVSSRSSHTAADVWAVGTRALTDKAGFALSAAGIQAIWDALTSALITAGSVGKKLADWVLGSDNKALLSNNAHTGAVIPTVTAITNDVGITQAGADKVWGTAARTLTTNSGIKKNTAFTAFEFFMRDSADHVTGKTGLTVTAERSIDGGAFAACANTAVEVANGIYKINLAATDLNGNSITFKFTAAGSDATLITIITVA